MNVLCARSVARDFIVALIQNDLFRYLKIADFISNAKLDEKEHFLYELATDLDVHLQALVDEFTDVKFKNQCMIKILENDVKYSHGITDTAFNSYKDFCIAILEEDAEKYFSMSESLPEVKTDDFRSILYRIGNCFAYHFVSMGDTMTPELLDISNKSMIDTLNEDDVDYEKKYGEIHE